MIIQNVKIFIYSSQSQDQMQCGFLLDVIIREGSTILKLFACKNKPLLVWGDAFLVLDLGLNVLDGIRSFHVKGDRFACQSLYKNLHASSESQDQMKGGLLLNVVVRQGSPILQLFACKNESLLVWGDALLILDLGLHVFD